MVNVKKLQVGEGGWNCAKEVLRWILDAEEVTVALPERKLEEILTILEIPAIQRKMVQKDLESLVGKICSMHLAVPWAVAYLCHVQIVLNQGGVDRVWLSPVFHRELADWKVLALQVASRPKHLAEIVRCEPTHLRFYDAPGILAGGVWLTPAGTIHNIVLRHPWPADVT